jgi:hypothetical protein
VRQPIRNGFVGLVFVSPAAMRCTRAPSSNEGASSTTQAITLKPILSPDGTSPCPFSPNVPSRRVQPHSHRLQPKFAVFGLLDDSSLLKVERTSPIWVTRQVRGDVLRACMASRAAYPRTTNEVGPVASLRHGAHEHQRPHAFAAQDRDRGAPCLTMNGSRCGPSGASPSRVSQARRLPEAGDQGGCWVGSPPRGALTVMQAGRRQYLSGRERVRSFGRNIAGHRSDGPCENANRYSRLGWRTRPQRLRTSLFLSVINDLQRLAYGAHDACTRRRERQPSID